MKRVGALFLFLTSIFTFLLLNVQANAGEVSAKQSKPEPPAFETREVPARPPKPDLSAFETYVQGGSVPGVSTDIKQFGYDLFDSPPSTFAPVDIMPVGPDYLLGPGDELKVVIWGKINADETLAIDRDGKVSLPQTGVVYLAGLTFAEAKSLLENELGMYYMPSEVKMNVSMGRLRTIRIFVVGKARRPGSYTLSSLSTLINALFASGGPSKIGSMRDIQVRRSNATIARFDLYDFILRGDKSGDIRLMPEDVVFIPPSGPLAGIAGNVKAPGIYELKGESTIKEIISLAGGLNEIAFRSRLQINRIIDNKREIVLEEDLEDSMAAAIKLQSADLVKVFSVVQDLMVVRLYGAVQREGEYGIGAGLSVKDLIDKAGGVKYYAYLDEAELTRVIPAPEGPKTEKIIVNLKKAAEGDPLHNISLENNDYLLVRSVPHWQIYKKVNVQGEFRFPGTYTIEKGERLSSVIDRAGGFTDRAYLKGAVFTRESVKELQQRQLDESIERLERQLLTGMAQGSANYSSDGDSSYEEVKAQRFTLISKLKTVKAKGRVSLNLMYLDRGSPSDLVLEDGDTLIVPETPSQIQVIGSVYNQTAFVYNPGYTIPNYIKKAGGLTGDADSDGVYVLKVDGTALSRKDAPSWGIEWDGENRRWVSGGFMSTKLDPGDTIVVPEKMKKVAWLREIKDFTQILYQIAVAAGVLIVVF